MKFGNKLAVPVHEKDHSKGRPDATIELVEYGDYECHSSGQAYEIVFRLLKSFGDDLHYVFRNFPVQSLHPHALSASKAAEAAGLQRRFWQMHQVIFENQNELDDDNLQSYADEIGLNLDQFDRAMTSPTILRRIEGDIDGAKRSGVDATPSFFINGRKYEDDWSYQALERLFRAILSGESMEEYLKAA